MLARGCPRGRREVVSDSWVVLRRTNYQGMVTAFATDKVWLVTSVNEPKKMTMVADEHVNSDGKESVNAPSARALRQSWVLMLVGGVAALLNGAFSLVFLRLDGSQLFASVSPLLTVGSVAATASGGVEYILTVRVARSRSAREATRIAGVILAASIPFLLLAPLLRDALRLQSTTTAALTIILFSVTFAQAIPNAILLAYGRLWTLGIFAGSEAAFRIIMFLPVAHHSPMNAALIVSIAVTVVGGLWMGIAGIRFGSQRDYPALTLERKRDHWLTESLVGLALFFPFVLPVWLARAKLATTLVTGVSVAALIASGVVMMSGFVTSSAVPHVVDANRHAILRRNRWLCLFVAIMLAMLGWVTGPYLVEKVLQANVANLASDLGPMAIAAPGWALLAFVVWIDIAQGRASKWFLGALTVGLAAQISLGLLIPTVTAVAFGPLLSLGISGILVLGCRRLHPLPESHG